MIKLFVTFIILAGIFNPSILWAKGGDEQDQIVLLNDSASALEDVNPGLSKILTKLANEKEIDWENKNANKNVPASPVIDKNSKQFKGQIKLLKSAAMAVQPTYPLIAKGLNQMVKDMERVTKDEK